MKVQIDIIISILFTSFKNSRHLESKNKGFARTSHFVIFEKTQNLKKKVNPIMLLLIQHVDALLWL